MRCGETLSRLGGVGGGEKRSPSEAPSSSWSARCTFPTPSLSIALKNRRAFVGARAGEEAPAPAPARRSQGRAEAAEVCTRPGIGLEGMCTLRSEAPGRWDLLRLLLPSFLLRGRGGAAGVRALAAAERALRCRSRGPGRPARRVPAQPRHLQKVHASDFNFPGPAGARSERSYARPRAWRKPCALSLFWPSSLGAGGAGVCVSGGSLSMTQEENAFAVPAPDPKFAPNPSIFS